VSAAPDPASRRGIGRYRRSVNLLSWRWQLLCALLGGLCGGLSAGIAHGVSAGVVTAVALSMTGSAGAGLSAGLGRRRPGRSLAERAVIAGAGLAVGLAVGMVAGIDQGWSGGLLAGAASTLGAGALASMGAEAVGRRSRLSQRPNQFAQRLAAVAAWLAGGGDPDRRESWLADLPGWSEHDRPVPTARQLRHACGYFVAAARIRLSSLAACAGRGLDWVLVSDTRICVVPGITVIAMTGYLVTQYGLIGLISNAQNVVVTGGGLYGAARVLRHTRGVRPPRG
jgi:hypothetical protein